jgi:DNA polymerase III, epsilon subunit and related 3''-5'' exonucleases
MNFVAIDFETANFKRSSACSVGIAVVKNGEIEKSYSFLIKPYPNYFEPINVSIHHIRPEMVKDSPTLQELWSEIYPIIKDKPLVAHNAPFDKSVLRSSIEAYDMECPNFEFYCSHKISKKLMPGLMSYKLSTVCGELDIDLNHHEAKSDAEGCAKVVLELAKRHSISSISELDEYAVTGKKRIIPPNDLPLTLFSLNVLNSIKKDDDHPFAKKIVVFTGRLKKLPRRDAETIVSKLGGIPKSSIVSNTSYLVVGIQDQTKNSEKSGKELKAEELIRNGADLEILDEDDFIMMAVLKGLSFEISEEQICRDEEWLIKRNKFNDFSKAKVFFSEGYRLGTLELCQMIGNSGGTGLPIEYRSDSELQEASYAVLPSKTIELLKAGFKDDFVLKIETSIKEKVINAGIFDIKIIGEEVFYLYMKMRENHINDIRRMNIHEWEVDTELRSITINEANNDKNE